VSANREPKTVSQNFTRGSEIWWHQANLFFVAARNALVISLIVGLAVAFGFMSWKAKDHEVRQLIDYSWSSLWDEVGLPQAA
jgi:hypothetical protein